MNSLRVVLADDHILVRSGIRLILESLPGVEVVAETPDGRQAVELVERMRPHVAVLDISMPGMNGIEATTRIVSRVPDTRVLILSMHAREEYVGQALRAGATGYLLKDASPLEFELALRAVARGESYLGSKVSHVLVENYLRATRTLNGPLDSLTDRQREILQMIAEGKSTKQIAAELGVSVKTVETHRALMMQRLDIHDLAGLVRFAVRWGLVRDDV